MARESQKEIMSSNVYLKHIYKDNDDQMSVIVLISMNFGMFVCVLLLTYYYLVVVVIVVVENNTKHNY